MADVTLSPVRLGNWTSYGTWVDYAAATHSSLLTGYAGFQGVGSVMSGAAITSATLTLTRVSGSGHADVSVVSGPVADPPANDGGTSLTRIPVGTTTSSSMTIDVTAAVAASRDTGAWSTSSVLGVVFDHASGGSTRWQASLQVVYVTVQYLDPVTAPSVLVRCGAVEVSSAVNAATATVTLTYPAPDVVAPVALAPTAATVSLTYPAQAWSGTGQAPPADVDGPAVVTLGYPTPTLARTLAEPPPPPPWERVITSPEYAAAIASRSMPPIDARVEILARDGAVIARLGGYDPTHPGVVAGSVTCDGDSTIRWTCDLTVDNDDLVPSGPGDLLHPLSWHRVRVWWRIMLSTGAWAEIPIGTYYLDHPAVTDSGEATVSMSLRGSDVMAVIKRSLMPMSMTVGGLSASEAATAILTAAAPWAQIALPPTPYRLPADYEAGAPDADPVEVAAEILRGAGLDLHADRMGVVVATPTGSTGHPVASLIEGPGCAAVSVSSSVDVGSLANVVTVTSGAYRDADGNEMDPISVTVRDEDPTSPLYAGGDGPTLRSPTITRDDITTREQARALALEELDRLRAPVEALDLVTFPMPHLDPGQAVEVSFSRTRIAGTRRVRSWQMALGVDGGQRITTTGRRNL